MQGIIEINNKILFFLINFIRFAETPTSTNPIKDKINGFITILLS